MSAVVNNPSKLLHSKFEQGRPALSSDDNNRKHLFSFNLSLFIVCQTVSVINTYVRTVAKLSSKIQDTMCAPSPTAQ